MQYYLKSTESMGRGLYASHDLEPNKELFICELLVLSQNDTKIVNSTDLQFYTFKYTENQDCLCLGLGEVFNHSDTPNVAYRLIDHDGRKVMQFYTTKTIRADDQLFIDYQADIKVETKQYVNKNLF